MEEFVTNFVLAMRLPPVNEFTEYIVPAPKYNELIPKHLK